jgi:hypothetical protein
VLGDDDQLMLASFFWVLGQFFGTRLHVLPRDQTGPEPYSTLQIWTVLLKPKLE